MTRPRNPYHPWHQADDWYYFERNAIEQEAIGKAAVAYTPGLSAEETARVILAATGHSYTDAAVQQAAQALSALAGSDTDPAAEHCAEAALRAAWEDGHLDFV